MKLKLILLFAASMLMYINQTVAQVTIGANNYTTLKAAFDAINNGVHTGAITVTFSGNTSEPVPAMLNASGTGASNYSSVVIYPVAAGIQVTGVIGGAPIIDLSGADNVTIDGRINATGTTMDLTIINAVASSLAQTSTVRMVNDASFNTIRYCTLKGSGVDNDSSGVVIIGAGSASGNNHNVVTHCNLTGQGINKPSNLILSIGSSGTENDSTLISFNNFYNIITQGRTLHAINIYARSSNINISNNSFYETDTVLFSGIQSATYYAVFAQHINNFGSDGFTLSNNYIGGSAPQCGGLPFVVKNGSFYMYGMSIETDTSLINSIQGNTVTNIQLINNDVQYFYGLTFSYGKIYVGNISGNIIGSSTGTGAVTLNNTGGGGVVRAINVLSGKKMMVENNSVGSFSMLGGLADFKGLSVTYISLTDTSFVENNLIGSHVAANSIQNTSGDTRITGIDCGTSAQMVVRNNVVANLSNLDGTSYIHGIAADGSNGNITIENDTVRNIIGTGNSFSISETASVTGIYNIATGISQSIKNNVVMHLANQSSTVSGTVVGILTKPDTSATVEVSGNFIVDLSHTINNAFGITGLGILHVNGTVNSTLNCFNNIISIDLNLYSRNSDVFGIYEHATGSATTGVTDNFYFNTVYIGGSEGGNNNSYSFYSDATNTTKNIRDNIFYNKRTNTAAGTAKHYAIGFSNSMNNTIIDNNNYFVSGTGGNIGFLTADQQTFTNWQNATGQDFGSLNHNPLFYANGGLIATNYMALDILHGTAIAGITTDFLNIARPAVPQMGALEISCFTAPAPAITAAGLILSTTQTFNSYQWLLNGDTITNATSQQYTVTANGTYTVIVTNSLGCSAVSGPIVIINVGIAELTNTGIKIYPALATNQITVLFNSPVANAEIKIYNLYGAVIYHSEMNHQSEINIDVSKLTAGVYFISIAMDKGNVVRKFVKD